MRNYTLPDLTVLETALIVDGGFTYAPQTGEFIRAGSFPAPPLPPFVSAYAIAVPNTVRPLTPQGLQDAVEDADDDSLIGGWVDSETGKTWFEFSQILLLSRSEAIEWGRARGQIAIMDMISGEEIRIPSES